MSKALTASITIFSRFMSGLYFSLSHTVVYPMATAKNSSVKRIINRSMFVTSTFGNLNNSLYNPHAALPTQQRRAWLAQNFTRIAVFIRFSRLRRSGVKPVTTEPGSPVLPPGGVTPPCPPK